MVAGCHPLVRKASNPTIGRGSGQQTTPHTVPEGVGESDFVMIPGACTRCSSTSWSCSGEFGRLMRAGDVETAAALVQPWHVAVGMAAAVIGSYPTVIACVLAVRRFGPGLPTAISRGRRVRVVVPTLVG